MRLKSLTSIRQLAVIGFALVVLPLMIALISAFTEVDQLSTQMQRVVRDSTQAVEASRIITAQVLRMERSAKQYLILRDSALLAHYETQREQLIEAVKLLSAMALDQSLFTRIQALSQVEKALYHTLKAVKKQSQGSRLQKPDELQDLTKLAFPIPLEVTRMVARESDDINRQLGRVHRLLLYQSVALIPLALLLAAVFGILISRPLNRLSHAIHRLGSGEFSTPVRVSGPRDIRELSQRLDWLRLRLAELDEQKLVFLHHVSHELKTPLTTIREGVELLRDEIVGAINQEQAEVVRILRQDSLQLQTQVEALLNFNLALAQEKPFQMEVVALDTLILEIIEKHQLAMRARKISVQTELQAVSISGEREKLQTVVDNLISNAIKYSPDNGEIQIRLQMTDHRACIEIIDAGPGILPGEREQIFEPFFQGRHLPRGHIKGTGLGLAIAQRYVRLHHGSIILLEEQQGAHFQVTLPITQPVEQIMEEK